MLIPYCIIKITIILSYPEITHGGWKPKLSHLANSHPICNFRSAEQMRGNPSQKKGGGGRGETVRTSAAHVL